MSIYSHFEHSGFAFKNETITNYFLSLKTKPFVIMSGISGSGKTKITELFSDFLINDPSQLEFFPVKPNWTDGKALIGYHNILENRYSITPLIKLMINAHLNPEKPYFLLLDEMNLAKVEHYFSDFLSYLESRRLDFGLNDKDISEIPLFLNDKLHNVKISLSEAIILSAIDLRETLGIDIYNTFTPISDYRENRFSVWWKENRFGGNSANWTPQYRTELNQGSDKRLASRVFIGSKGHYRLRKETEMSDGDISLMKEYERLYASLKTRVVQQKMKLHNSTDYLLSSKSNIENKAIEDTIEYSQFYDIDTDSYFIPSDLEMPLNLFVIGTVNIDESTYMFSPKVLDRANIIEFNNIDINSLLNNDSAYEESKYNDILDDRFILKDPIKIDMELTGIPHSKDTQKFHSSAPSEFSVLVNILEILKKHKLHFGYRIINEVSRYANIAEIFVVDFQEKYFTALDIQILQKILPKFHGSIQKLWSPLIEILNTILKVPQNIDLDIELEVLLEKIFEQPIGNTDDITNDNYIEKFNCPRSAKKIVQMLNSLKRQGFVSFIE